MCGLGLQVSGLRPPALVVNLCLGLMEVQGLSTPATSSHGMVRNHIRQC